MTRILTFIFIAGLMLLVSAEQKFTDLGQQKGHHEGDIILTGSMKKNRNGILRADRWTDGIIPYVINSTGYTQNDVDMIEEGMRTIEKSTCIRFVKRKDQKDFVNIGIGGGCASGLGMAKGEQYLTLAKPGCMIHRTIVHELLHTVGLWHEQARYDRDEYITVKWENLPEGHLARGGVVMDPKDPFMLGVMGYSPVANETDFEKVRRLYECEGKFAPSAPAPPCADKWPDCNEQSDQCGKEKSTIENCAKTCGYCEWGKPITATPRPCQDYRPDCASFLNDCKTNKEWRERTCPLSCGTCDKSKTPYPTTTPKGNVQPNKGSSNNGPCVDTYEYCDLYIKGCKVESWMTHGCRKSCKFC